MDPNFLIRRATTLSHRHGNEWVRLERRDAHSPVHSDPERRWGTDTIYVCPRCDEEIRIEEEPTSAAPR